MQEIKPLRLGLKKEPPMLILVYRKNGTLRRLSVPIRRFEQASNNELVDLFMQKHKSTFGKLNDTVIERFIIILRELLEGKKLEDALKKVEPLVLKQIDENDTDFDLDDGDIPLDKINDDDSDEFW